MPHQTSPSFVLAAIITSSALLTITVATGLKAIPGWDAGLRGVSSGHADDPWRLRTSDPGAMNGAETSATRLPVAEEVAEERRVVRVVYPGLTGSR